MEPTQLRRGKLFHTRVQTAWAGTIAGKQVRAEHGIRLGLVSTTSTHTRRGRIDLFIDQYTDFVTVVEINLRIGTGLRKPTAGDCLVLISGKY